jgi:hypothetical protein
MRPACLQWAVRRLDAPGIPSCCHRFGWLGRFVIHVLLAIGIAQSLCVPVEASDLEAPRAPSVAPHPPAGVPADFVVTPVGYFHPTCVRAIRQGETVLADGRIEGPDGRIAPVRRCPYSHYASDGTRLDGDAVPRHSGAGGGPGRAPDANGWLEASWYIGSAAFGAIGARWGVPASPLADVGQVLYFFPGLEDVQNVRSILQPVLGWNGYDDHAWSIASWNCCMAGVANHSNPVVVSTGDIITGAVRNRCSAGKVCARWDVQTIDASTGEQTLLGQTSSYGQTFDWAFAGVVEVYGVSACDQYPGDGFVDFWDVFLYDSGKRQIHGVPWQAPGLMQPNAPTCNYNVTVAPYSASLTF